MRLQITPEGNIRATMQPRPDGSQSRPFCCDDGHEDVQAAAKHGSELEVADELEFWLGLPRPEIVTEHDALVPVPGEAGLFRKQSQPVEPHLAEGHRAVYVFDKRLLAAKEYPHMTRRGSTVKLLGVAYRVVHEGPASVAAVRVPG